jgi:hypothetical protein
VTRLARVFFLGTLGHELTHLWVANLLGYETALCFDTEMAHVDVADADTLAAAAIGVAPLAAGSVLTAAYTLYVAVGPTASPLRVFVDLYLIATGAMWAWPSRSDLAPLADLLKSMLTSPLSSDSHEQ